MAKLIPQEKIDEVLEQTDIVQIIENYVELKKTGKNYFGYCPFHDEKTPSFSVSPDKQIYHCFSCGRGGNVFGFLMERDNLSFPEAVIKTAELGHLELSNELQKDGYDSSKSDRRKVGTAALAKAGQFYQHTLKYTPIGEVARDYLNQRKLSSKAVDEFQIGFAPADRTLVGQIMSQNNFDTEELIQSGLFQDPDNQKELIGRFQNRLMIPLRDEQGEIIAFSGRIIPALTDEEEDSQFDQAKYINSPQTKLFNKGHFLFNLDLAKREIRKVNEVFLLEGYMDVISVYDAGIKQVVASLGTSLTESQINRLRSLTHRIVLGYDGDTPGMKATKRAIDLLRQTNHFEISVIPWPKGCDPDDYIKKHGAKQFLSFYQHNRETPFEFSKRFLEDQFRKTNSHDLMSMIPLLLSELKHANPIERDRYFSVLSEEFDISVDSLKEEFVALISQEKRDSHNKRIYQNVRIEPMKRDQIGKVERAERQILYRLMTKEIAWSYLPDDPIPFQSDNYQNLFWALVEFHQDKQAPFDVKSVLSKLNSETERGLLTEISLVDFDLDFTREEFDDLIRTVVDSVTVAQQIEKLKKELNEASRSGDKDKSKQIALKIMTLMNQKQKGDF